MADKNNTPSGQFGSLFRPVLGCGNVNGGFKCDLCGVPKEEIALRTNGVAGDA